MICAKCGAPAVYGREVCLAHAGRELFTVEVKKCGSCYIDDHMRCEDDRCECDCKNGG